MPTPCVASGGSKQQGPDLCREAVTRHHRVIEGSLHPEDHPDVIGNSALSAFGARSDRIESDGFSWRINPIWKFPRRGLKWNQTDRMPARIEM